MLKKIVFFSMCFAALLTSFLIVSCENEFSESFEEELNQHLQNENKNIDSTQCAIAKSTVYLEKGKLVFQDMEHFEQCAECLEQEYDTYNDNYETQYPSLNPEELDSMDLVNGFDEWTSYIQFESLFNFNSLRAKIENEIVQWLDTPADAINFDDDPDEKTPVMDESIRTLLNEDGLAIVADSIISTALWEDDDLNKEIPDECANSKKTKDYYYAEDHPALEGRRLKLKIKVSSGLISSKLKAKVVHYKRKNGKWKRRRADLKIFVDGPQQSPNCVLLTGSSNTWSDTNGWKNKKSLKAKDKVNLLWREAFVDETDPRWLTERCWTTVFFDKNENYFFSLPLMRADP